jgi:hypothetical protein
VPAVERGANFSAQPARKRERLGVQYFHWISNNLLLAQMLIGLVRPSRRGGRFAGIGVNF